MRAIQDEVDRVREKRLLREKGGKCVFQETSVDGVDQLHFASVILFRYSTDQNVYVAQSVEDCQELNTLIRKFWI